MTTPEESETAPAGGAAMSPRMKSWDPACFAVPFDLLHPEIKAARSAAGLLGSGLEFKSLPTEIKTTAAKRRVELWVGAFGNVDDGGDVIPYGAAGKSIERDGPGGQNLVKFFWNHSMLLGPAETVEEHKTGILMVGKVDEDTSLDRYLKHAESGAAAHGSIGYEVVRQSKKVMGGQTIRSLDEIKLYEGSLVIWPMNRNATVEGVKSYHAGAGGGLQAKGAATRQRKGLYDFAELVTCLASLQSNLRYLQNLRDYGWAALTPEEAAVVQQFIEMLTNPESTGEASPLAAVMEALSTLEGSKGAMKRLEDIATTKNDQGLAAALAAYTANLRKSLGSQN